jgi:16S rRNA (guanine(966)-N(2))-methyltransferase RsmD
MNLRIYGNRLLKTLPGQETRPTVGRVREAVFNIWQGAIAGCHWLDLCAGSGSMGAEALCRGAARVVGIEQSSRACGLIQHNWQQVAGEGQTFEVIRGDVVKKLPTLVGQTFDRIYFDPPYASGWYDLVLAAIADYNVLAAGGELAVEHSPGRPPFSLRPSLEVCRQKVYGNTALTFFAVHPPIR